MHELELEQRPTKARWIPAIQGLRAVAFLAIFVTHSGLGSFAFLGAWGVSVFLMLSGFLMAYQYLQKPEEPVFGLRFAWSKVRSLYPLHIVTMVAMLPFAFSHVLKGSLSLVTLFVDVALNVGMLHAWVTFTLEALNGPSWFMCAIAFAYFLFPLIIKRLKALRSTGDALLLIGCFAAVYAVAGVVAYMLDANGAAPEIVKWCTYYFPPVRFCDFGIGCALGWLFLNADKSKTIEMSRLVNGAGQIACFLLIAASMVAYATEAPFFGSRPVRPSLLFLPTTAVLIWLVASCSGAVQRVWSMGWIMRVGDLSPYAFLIHGVVLNYVSRVFKAGLPAAPKVVAALVALAITLVTSAWWSKAVAARKAKAAAVK